MGKCVGRRLRRLLMTIPDPDRWLNAPVPFYPLTIIDDRYDGLYSGGPYLAFPLHFNEVPAAVRGPDLDCAGFWREQDTGKHPIPCGRGGSPEAAFQELKDVMAKKSLETG